MPAVAQIAPARLARLGGTAGAPTAIDARPPEGPAADAFVIPPGRPCRDAEVAPLAPWLRRRAAVPVVRLPPGADAGSNAGGGLAWAGDARRGGHDRPAGRPA